MDHVEDILREFAERIRAAVKQEMMNVLLSGPGLAPASVKRGPGRSPKARTTASTPKRKKGAKRDPREIASLTTQLGSAIRTGPGHRIEQLAKMLEVSTKELALPVKRLLAEKKIKTTGNRRATKYFPS